MLRTCVILSARPTMGREDVRRQLTAVLGGRGGRRHLKESPAPAAHNGWAALGSRLGTRLPGPQGQASGRCHPRTVSTDRTLPPILPRGVGSWACVLVLAAAIVDVALLAAGTLYGAETLAWAFFLGLVCAIAASIVLASSKGGAGSYRWAAASGLVLSTLVFVMIGMFLILLANAMSEG